MTNTIFFDPKNVGVMWYKLCQLLLGCRFDLRVSHMLKAYKHKVELYLKNTERLC